MAIHFRKASSGDPTSPKEVLRLLKKADDAYYNKDAPIMSDAKYDKMREKAVALAKAGDTELKAYLKKVGAPVRASKRSEKLPTELGSLRKVKSDDDKSLLRFIANAQKAAREHGANLATKGKEYAGVAKLWSTGHVTVITSPKLDGLTFLLHYQNGVLVNAFTRGDGTNAQSKKEHALELAAHGRLPKTLPKAAFHKFAKRDLYVKGEIVCRLKTFDAKWKGKGYTNARNAASGWLNSDKASHPIGSAMDFLAYDVFTPEGELGIDFPIPTTSAGPASDKHHTLTCLDKAGFKTYLKTPFFSVFSLKGEPADTWLANVKAMLNRIDSAPYLLDGIVIEVSNNHVRKILGSTDGRPKFAIAYKTSADDLDNNEGADSVITRIEYNTSKVGALKPTLHYKPVTVMDSTLSKATGNNVSYLVKNGLGVGSKVRVVKAGGIIPKVHLIGSKATPDKILPTKCECGALAVEVKKDGKAMPDWYCSKPSKCKIIQRELLGASIKQLGIIGLAGKTIDKLFDAGYTDLPRLLSMSDKSILAIEGFGKSMVTSIKVALPAAIKKCSTAELMDMSGVFMQPGLSLGTSSLVKLEKTLGKDMKLRDKPGILKAIGAAKGQLFIDKYPDWVTYKTSHLGKFL